MATSKIAAEIERIEKQIASLEEKLKSLRKKCSHNPKHIREKYEGNTGNYDPHSDCYWVSRDCLNCGEHWMIDSDKPGYRSVIPFTKQFRDDKGFQIYREN